MSSGNFLIIRFLSAHTAVDYEKTHHPSPYFISMLSAIPRASLYHAVVCLHYKGYSNLARRFSPSVRQLTALSARTRIAKYIDFFCFVFNCPKLLVSSLLTASIICCHNDASFWLCPACTWRTLHLSMLPTLPPKQESLVRR